MSIFVDASPQRLCGKNKILQNSYMKAVLCAFFDWHIF